MAIVTLNSCTGKVPEERACALRGETCKKLSYKGTRIVLDAKMILVPSLERVSFLPVSLASTQKAYVVDEVGKKLPPFRPGTKWCISCRKNADKIFSATRCGVRGQG